MKELRFYQEMIVQFQQKMGAVHPLICGMEFMRPGLVGKSICSDDVNCLLDLMKEKGWQTSVPFVKYLYNDSYTLVVTDPEQKIEWVSKGFEKMTGYTAEEVIGRRPTFLQGEKTDRWTRLKIKERLSQQKKVEASIVNYRKSGESYTCQVKILPILNAKRELVNFVAIEKEGLIF